MNTHVTWPVGLTKRSEVLILADRTGVTPREAAAAWMEFLEWVSCQESAPVLPGISLETIDRLVSLSGFAATLGQQKWLTQRSDGIHVQQWDEVWSPAVAARKVATAQRSRRRAEVSGQKDANEPAKPLFCPDKSPTPPVCSFGFLSLSEGKAVQTAWDDFCKHREEKDKKGWTKSAQERNAKKVADIAKRRGAAAAIVAIGRSIECGWTGIFEPPKDTEHDLRVQESTGTAAWFNALPKERRDAMLGEYRAKVSKKDQDRPGAFMRWAEQRREHP